MLHLWNNLQHNYDLLAIFDRNQSATSHIHIEVYSNIQVLIGVIFITVKYIYTVYINIGHVYYSTHIPPIYNHIGSNSLGTLVQVFFV